jgi:hypothetical protein
MKFMRPNGEIYYTRFVVLHKEPDGLYYSGTDLCVEEITPTDQEGIFETVLYIPQRDSKVTRITPTNLVIDEPMPFVSFIESHRMLTTSIDPVYTIARMMEILAILSDEKPCQENLYDYKKTLLLKMLDIALEGYLEAERRFFPEWRSSQKILTKDDFWEFHDYYYNSIMALRGFFKLETSPL